MSKQSDITLTGGCYCRAVRYTVRPDTLPTAHNFCHCRTCQQISGSAFIPFIGFPESSVSWLSSPPDARRSFATSKFATRDFCGICGSTLTMSYHAAGDRVSLAVGSFDEESAKLLPKPSIHIYLGDKAEWYALGEGDGMERHQTMKRAEEYLGGQQGQSGSA